MKLRVPDQNRISQASYMVKIDHSGPKPSKYNLNIGRYTDSSEKICFKLGMMVDITKLYSLIPL